MTNLDVGLLRVRTRRGTSTMMLMLARRVATLPYPSLRFIKLYFTYVRVRARDARLIHSAEKSSGKTAPDACHSRRQKRSLERGGYRVLRGAKVTAHALPLVRPEPGPLLTVVGSPGMGEGRSPAPRHRRSAVVPRRPRATGGEGG